MTGNLGTTKFNRDSSITMLTLVFSMFLIGTGWALSAGTTSVSSNDTVKGHLDGKLVEGANIDFTVSNDGSNESMTIATDDGIYVGNVGVGTTSTSYRLEVDGQSYFGGTNGGTVFEADGSLYSYGNATWYDDLQIQLVAARATYAPTYTDVLGSRLLTFSDEPANEDEIPFVAQFPHAYKFGSPIDFHIHFIGQDTTSCNFKWSLTYTFADPYKAFPTQGTIYTTTANSTTANYHNMADFSNITPDPAIYGYGASTILIGKFARNSTSADDTCDGKVAYLLQADLHLERNTIGSRQEINK